ncbi:MAG: hypothetical protein U0073_11885 [Bacteroidia bacterium]
MTLIQPVENKPLRYTRRELSILFILFIPMAVMIAINDHAPMLWKTTHPFTDAIDGVLKQEFPGPLVYRVFVPWLLESVHSIIPSISYVKFDFGLKIILLSGIFFAFYFYLKNFFSTIISLLSIFWLAILIDYSLSFFLGSNVFESSDLLNVLVLCLCLLFLFRRQWFLFNVILFLGMFNRETPFILLVPLFLMYHGKQIQLKHFLISVIVLIIPYVCLRLYIHPQGGQHFFFDFIQQNFPYPGNPENRFALKSLLRLSVLLGPLLILAWIKVKQKNNFLKNAGAAFLLLLPIHFLLGRVIESRLWMPAFVLLIPLAMDTIQSYALRENNSATD